VATSIRWALCLGGLLSLSQQILGAYATRTPQIVSENLTEAALAMGSSATSLWSEMGLGSVAVVLGGVGPNRDEEESSGKPRCGGGK